MKKTTIILSLLFLCFITSFAQDSYRQSPNFGKSIAVFGGSFSVIPASDVAKDYWKYVLDCKVTNYGIGGAGFSKKTQEVRYIPTQIEKSVKSGNVYDIYILWASTNDCAQGVSIEEQDSQIELCIERIQKIAPKAKILFFTSLPVPLLPKFSSIDKYVEGQLMVCAKYGIPCLNLYTDSGLNKWNAVDFFSPDKLHLNWDGYNHIKETLARFIANN